MTIRGITAAVGGAVGARGAGPVLAMLLACVCLAGSALFVKLAGVDAATTAFLRCAIAVALLAPLAVREARRRRPLSRRGVLFAVAAGTALGIDYVAWNQSIYDVGAGISTVLLNIQVVALPALAWLIDRERIPRRFLVATPVMLLGVALVGGVAAGPVDFAPAPLRGTVLGLVAGLGYALYLYFTRRGGRHEPGLLVQTVTWATAAAAVSAAIIATVTTGLHLTSIPAESWALIVALAVIGQVLAFLFLTYGSPRLTPSVGAGLLLIHPVLTLVLSAIVLAEHPEWTQWVGAALVLLAVAHANRVLAWRGSRRGENERRRDVGPGRSDPAGGPPPEG